MTPAKRSPLTHAGHDGGVRPAQAATIPESFIAAVKERADVVETIGARVQLKKSGASYMGLCPFHGEKSPSFSVSTQRQLYHCFGCGAGGDALRFVMEYDGLSFRAAVQQLAASVGMKLPRMAAAPRQGLGLGVAPGAAGPAPSDKRNAQAGSRPGEPPDGDAHTEDHDSAWVDPAPLHEAMARAGAHYRRCLGSSDEAKNYLKGRGFTRASVQRYAIGFAPANWQGLKEVFQDYEDSPYLLDAGLVRHAQSKEAAQDPGAAPAAAGRRYDTFRGRVTFGLRDMRGRIVAFGARTLGDDKPKYINSPETIIFDKSESLFGLFEAREAIRKHKAVFVFEGYTDVIMCAQHGLENSVATMGTACTEQHIERLMSQATRLIFCFDGDGAGKQAAWKALNRCAPLIRDNSDFRFLMLPDGMDPDEFVRQQGADAMRALGEQAPGFAESLIRMVRQRCGIGSDSDAKPTTEQLAMFAAEAMQIAKTITPRQHIKRLIMQRIDRECAAPGSSLAAVKHRMEQRRLDTQRPGPWHRLLQACEQAPQEAARMSHDILALLDPQSPDEQELIAALQEAAKSLPQESSHSQESREPRVEGEIPRPAPQPVRAAHKTSAEVLAEDILRSAAALIEDWRRQQAIREIDDLLHSGSLSEEEYIEMRASIQYARRSGAIATSAPDHARELEQIEQRQQPGQHPGP